MAKVAPSRNTKKELSNANIKKLRSVVIISIVIVAILLLLWPFVRNESLYVADKEEVKTNVQSVLDQVQPAGSQIYSEVVDLGCDSGSSVGLATFIYCEIAGYKFVKTRQSDPRIALRSVDSMLMNNEWQRSLLTDQTSEEFEQVLGGAQRGTTEYQRDGLRLTIYSRFYQEDGQPGSNDSAIENLIKNEKIPTPEAGEYIYGADIRATYWSCRDNSLFKLPCPSPPSKPE